LRAAWQALLPHKADSSNANRIGRYNLMIEETHGNN